MLVPHLPPLVCQQSGNSTKFIFITSEEVEAARGGYTDESAAIGADFIDRGSYTCWSLCSELDRLHEIHDELKKLGDNGEAYMHSSTLPELSREEVFNAFKGPRGLDMCTMGGQREMMTEDGMSKVEDIKGVKKKASAKRMVRRQSKV